MASNEESSGNLRSPLEARLANWLQEQGYPLEMRAAAALREQGLEVVQSYYYFDQQAQTHREIDLRASYRMVITRKMMVDVELVIECKSSPDKPWVLFLSPFSMHPTARTSQRFVARVSGSEQWWDRLARSRAVQRAPLLTFGDHPAHALIRASLGKSTEDVAYGALMAVTRAAAGMLDQLNEASRDEFRHYAVVIPIVVLNAPLFTCTTSGDGSLVLNRVSRGTLLWSNRARLSDSPHTIIPVLTEPELPSLATETVATGQTIASKLRR
jgi:hypothetical protein